MTEHRSLAWLAGLAGIAALAAGCVVRPYSPAVQGEATVSTGDPAYAADDSAPAETYTVSDYPPDSSV